MTERFTSSSFAGTSRKLVAVGTASERSMFSTMRAPTPRICVPGGSTAAPGAEVAAGGRVAAAGVAAGVAAGGVAGAATSGVAFRREGTVVGR